MTTGFHERTLSLLGPNAPSEQASVSKLISWGHLNGIRLPEAFVEWARLGGEQVLTKYSNMDSFCFQEPRIVSTPDGVQGLLFHKENQGNFQKIAVLNGSDDPPVLFGCIGEPPWVVHASRFSDCVYAQIFDWQYMLDNGEITYYGDVRLRTDRCVGLLKSRFEQTVTTRYVMDERHTTEYRFIHSFTDRLTVGVREENDDTSDEGKAYIVITGQNASVKILEGELFEAFSDDVIPPSFSSPRMATGELVRRFHCGTTQVRHMAIERLSLEVVAWLAECDRVRSLDERLIGQWFPKTGERFAVGDDDLGVRLHFLRKNANWWWFERIELLS